MFVKKTETLCLVFLQETFSLTAVSCVCAGGMGEGSEDGLVPKFASGGGDCKKQLTDACASRDLGAGIVGPPVG